MLDDLKTREFSKSEARNLNPLQLAIIGDAVYEVFIRTNILTLNIGLSAHKIHRNTVQYVKAEAQSKIVHEILEDLSDEETYVFKRGRNAKSQTVPKNANIRDYRMATGFEALVGYLYLINDKKRLEFVMDKSISIIK